MEIANKVGKGFQAFMALLRKKQADSAAETWAYESNAVMDDTDETEYDMTEEDLEDEEDDWDSDDDD